ncbi:MAG: tRNA (N6-isopentenyl adenosine(37)-C2)-methylthiotransferase MiaB, partial [Rectinemataceae bacterium]
MTYLMETYGCQMNRAESAAIDILFRERGWEAAAPSPAGQAVPIEAMPDLVVINTCSVRITAESRAWGRIDHWAGEKARLARSNGRKLTLIVTGCMAERLKKGI